MWKRKFRPTEHMAKVAIVTGGARGIGRACAHALATSGFDIAIVDLLRPEMERTQGELREIGRKAEIYEADVASFARAQEVVADVKARFGRVDFLLNDAGKANPASILDITEEEFDRTIAVNLKSCFNYIKSVAPIMLAQGEGEREGGRIVSMSSINALSGGVTSAVSKHSYAAAKAGILGLTRSLAKEFGARILINAICPGVIKTELGNTLTRSREPELIKGIALGRLGSPQDVAQMVNFLATSEPCYLTGQHFVIDGFQWSC
jgi:3-oxoacyl-[acyl-carrier protein] reductase